MDQGRRGEEGGAHGLAPPSSLLSRFANARVARLGTVDPTGRPHLVPVTFAVLGNIVALAVDWKPKRTTELQRIRNIRANPAVALLVDEYDDADWSRLWWVRVDGIAQVLEDTAARTALLESLRDKYPQYRHAPPQGPVVRVDITGVRGWAGESPLP